jgi:hypothetical protein
MSKKHLLLALSVFLCLAGVAAPAIYSKSSFFRKNTQQQEQQPAAAKPVPRHIAYWLLFQHIHTLRQKAAEMEAQNKDGHPYRHHYQLAAKLSDQQNQSLDSIVDQTTQAVAELDRQAGEIIARERAKYPGGRIVLGQAPPQTPPQLKAMQQQRDTLVLEAYNRLKESFGEKEFARFEKYLKENLEPHIQPLKLDERNNRLGPRPQNFKTLEELKNRAKDPAPVISK